MKKGVKRIPWGTIELEYLSSLLPYKDRSTIYSKYCHAFPTIPRSLSAVNHKVDLLLASLSSSLRPPTP